MKPHNQTVANEELNQLQEAVQNALSKRRRKDLMRSTLSFAISFTVAFALFHWVVCFHNVPTASMEPAIPTGSIIVAWRLPFLFADPMPKRGDIVVFYDHTKGCDLVKRVIGVPGDKIAFVDGDTELNGALLAEEYVKAPHSTLGEGEYAVPDNTVFVMGDNRMKSVDSRSMTNPYIPINHIKARVVFAIKLPTWLAT